MRHTLRRAVPAVALAATTAVALTVPSPAHAADGKPTISAPASTAGYHTIVISGTATPGATVELYESAYVFHDLQPAVDWANTGDLVTTTATASGTYRISRWVDTGFLFAVQVNGVMSNTVTVRDRLVPILTLSSTRKGTVTARMVATPAQPWVPVQIQRKNSNGTWSVVARGYTTAPGAFTATLTKLKSGTTYTYRAWLGGDTESALLAAYSSAHRIKVK
ncbi:MAG TPA: hypothetical protein VH502_00355 [Actinoplanes sp.]|jgi:hypothetical protein